MKYFGAGIGGLGLIGTGSIAAGILIAAPRFAAPGFLTLVLVSAGCIARAYSAYEYKAELMRRDLRNRTRRYLDVVEDWTEHHEAERFYVAGVCLLFLTGVWLLAFAWISAYFPNVLGP